MKRQASQILNSLYGQGRAFSPLYPTARNHIRHPFLSWICLLLVFGFFARLPPRACFPSWCIHQALFCSTVALSPSPKTINSQIKMCLATLFIPWHPTPWPIPFYTTSFSIMVEQGLLFCFVFWPQVWGTFWRANRKMFSAILVKGSSLLWRDLRDLHEVGTEHIIFS